MECVVLGLEHMDQKFTPQIWMLTLELFYAFIFLIVCIFENGRNIDTPWKAYEAVYFACVNSCTSVGFVVNAALRLSYTNDSRYRVDVFFAASIILLLPALVTHVLPGMVCFFWMPVGALFITTGVLGAVRIVRQRGLANFGVRKESVEFWQPKLFVLLNVITRLLITFVVTLMLQTVFNYQVLHYHKDEFGLSWPIDIMRYELRSRRFDCLLQRWAADATHMLQILSTAV
jgi:hypothetical protein